MWFVKQCDRQNYVGRYSAIRGFRNLKYLHVEVGSLTSAERNALMRLEAGIRKGLGLCKPDLEVRFTYKKPYTG